MADDAQAQNTQDEGAEPKQGKMMSAALLLLGLGIGGAGGLVVVGPLVAGPSGSESHAVEAEDDGHGESSGGHGSGSDISDDGVDPLLHTLTNVIVNPAASGGSRFLLLDVAFRLSTEEAVTELSGRDPEVRDALIHMLGVRTVTELADISARDAMKREMQALVSSILATGRVTAVFFPRYVIQ